MRLIKKGATDQSIYFDIMDSASSTGGRKTGLAYNTASLTAYYVRNGAAATAITLVTLAAANSAHADGGFKEVDATNTPGVYRLDLPDAAVASGADSVVVTIRGASGMVQSSYDIQLVAFDPQSDFPATITSMLSTITGYIDTEVSAIKAKTDNLPSDPADASDIASAFSTVNSTLTTLGGYIDTEVAAIKAKTDNLPPDPADASDIASQFSSVTSSLNTIASYIDTEVSAIKAKTDNLPLDPADASDIASAFSTVNTKLDTIDGRIDTEVAAIKAKTDNLPSAPASTSDVTTAVSTLSASLATIDGRLDTEIPAIKAKTDLIPAAPAQVSDIPTANQNADALLDRANGIESGYTLRQVMRLMASVLLGKSSGHPGSPKYRDVNDTKDRVIATTASGNRSAVGLDPS